MHDFTKLQAYKKLQELAKDPIDLAKPGSLTKERLKKFQGEACGYTLFYGTERVTETVIDQLFSLAKEAGALEWMGKMQGGETVNIIEGYPSEARAALHTATRDFFDRPQTAGKAAEAKELALEEVRKLQEFMGQIDREQRFTDMILVGIGGSDLGPRAMYLALQPYGKGGRRVHFISNVDPDDAAKVLNGVACKNALVVVVSKSGTTLETRTNEELLRARFEKEGIQAKERFIAVTGKGSPMDDPERYGKSFYIWDWIGGRYSSTSMVGGVILSFAYGPRVFEEFLKGANAMDKVALSEYSLHNLPLTGALLGIWNRNFLQLPTLAVIPYSQALIRFPAHVQQLDMESNGKRIDRRGNAVDFETGPIIWGEPGTNSQHSFFQLIHQGTSKVPIEFIGFKESQEGMDAVFQGTTSQQKLLANLFAQCLALAVGKQEDNPNKTFPGNRPSHILLAKKLTPFSLGALLSYFEHKIAFQGFIWGINSFDQEGVQLGKQLATGILDTMQGASGKTVVDLALPFLEKIEGMR